MKPLATTDLAQTLRQAEDSLASLRGASLFLTGGTGFFGHWLLESILHADRELNLKLRLTVLTRDAARFRAASPQVAAAPQVHLLEGDVRSFAFPAEPHTHIVHAATDTAAQSTDRPAYELAESILEGTRHVLHFARETGAARLLYVSSGAVYGRSTTIAHTPETFNGSNRPTTPAGRSPTAARIHCSSRVPTTKASAWQNISA